LNVESGLDLSDLCQNTSKYQKHILKPKKKWVRPKSAIYAINAPNSWPKWAVFCVDIVESIELAQPLSTSGMITFSDSAEAFLSK
jgi:hypothetical protein